MEGFIELVNRSLGRYAVRTDAGDYTLFETVGDIPLEIDELVWGDFYSIPGERYRTERHGEVDVVALCCYCARRDALRWVEAREASVGIGKLDAEPRHGRRNRICQSKTCPLRGSHPPQRLYGS